MPKFYQSRIDYFQPSFEALIRAQVGDLTVCTPGRCAEGHKLVELILPHWSASDAQRCGLSSLAPAQQLHLEPPSSRHHLVLPRLSPSPPNTTPALAMSFPPWDGRRRCS